MSAGDRLDRITEMMDRLMDQEEKYETFLDASPWGILVTDKTFRIVFMNKTLERMSGYGISELIGQSIHDLMPKEDIKVHIAHEKKYINNQHPREGNHGLKPRILCKNGAIIPVEISLSPTKVHGQTFFFASIRNLHSLFNTVERRKRPR